MLADFEILSRSMLENSTIQCRIIRADLEILCQSQVTSTVTGYLAAANSEVKKRDFFLAIYYGILGPINHHIKKSYIYVILKAQRYMTALAE